MKDLNYYFKCLFEEASEADEEVEVASITKINLKAHRPQLKSLAVLSIQKYLKSQQIH